MLPFQQPVGALIHLQSVLAIEVGRQAGRDLTSEAMQPRKAVKLFFVDHKSSPTGNRFRFEKLGPSGGYFRGGQLSVENFQRVLLCGKAFMPWLFSNSGPVVKLSMNILAGSRVLSAVGTRPP